MTALVRYEAACRALAEARSVDEVKEVFGQSDAMRVYARQAKNTKLENDAKIIRWRAIRRMGEMIASQPKAKAGRRPKEEEIGLENNPISLEEAGVDKNLAHLARRYAAMEETSFDRLVARCQAYNDGAERLPLDVLAREEKEARRATEAAAYAERTAVGCNITDLQILADEGSRFGVIYADPPWEFRVYSGKGKDRSADRHYNTGGLDAIKALPVAALAADDCALLMWAVMPELPGALEVIKAWGFEYKTVGFTWIKQNKSGEGLFWGMGYWTRANAEVCLLATKGHPERIAKDVHQVLLAPVTEHSRKPDEFHLRIERLLRGPYLELYARREREGWTTWGNEIPRANFAPTDASGDPVEFNESTGEIESQSEAQQSSDSSAPETEPALRTDRPLPPASAMSSCSHGDGAAVRTMSPKPPHNSGGEIDVPDFLKRNADNSLSSERP